MPNVLHRAVKSLISLLLQKTQTSKSFLSLVCSGAQKAAALRTMTATNS